MLERGGRFDVHFDNCPKAVSKGMRALGWSCLAIAEGTEIPSAMLTLESYEDCTTVARRDHAPVQEAYLVKSPSIFFIIRSAHWMLASMSSSVRGLPCGVPNRSSAVCICRLARIAAIIPITRFRPSSRSEERRVGKEGRRMRY